MLELLGLVVFGAIVYMFLVIVPTTIEKLGSEEFRSAYFSHLASKHITSFGK